MSSYDVAIVGAGTAGLAAAVSAADAGARVVVLDDRATPGGVLPLHPAERAGMSLCGEDLPGPDLARRLVARVARAGVEIRLATTVWGLFPGPVLEIAGVDGAGDAVRAGAVVVTTGAVDAPLPFPGWAAPGVMGARAAREMLYRQEALPGRRVLIAGSSSDAVGLALELAAAGVDVAGLLEAWAEPLASAAALAPLQQRHIPVRTGTTIGGVDGDDGVRAVTLVRGDDAERVEVDAIIVAGQIAEATLPRMAGATMRYDTESGTAVVAHDEAMRAAAGVYVAGHVTGAPSIAVSLAQGALAGTCAAADAQGREPASGAVARYRQDAADATAAARSLRRPGVPIGHPLLRFLPREGSDDVIICRCEELSLATVMGAVMAGARSQDAVKRRTRAGMGICQGRLCGSVINALIADTAGLDPAALELMTARGPARPIPVAVLTRPFAAFDRMDDES